jgi:hypothetical protein
MSLDIGVVAADVANLHAFFSLHNKETYRSIQQKPALKDKFIDIFMKAGNGLLACQQAYPQDADKFKLKFDGKAPAFGNYVSRLAAVSTHLRIFHARQQTEREILQLIQRRDWATLDGVLDTPLGLFPLTIVGFLALGLPDNIADKLSRQSPPNAS